MTVTEFSGEVVVQEITLTIDFDEIEERLRLGILVLWTGSILLDAERWRRRHDVAVVVALRTARERLGLPGDGG